jgi:acyl carrier protein
VAFSYRFTETGENARAGREVTNFPPSPTLTLPLFFVIVFLRTIMDNLKQQIKELIISALELEDIKPENIVDAEPLFGEGLGLDSIDALELGVALKKKFGVKFSSENADNKRHFASVDALAAYIETVGGTA